MQNYARLFKIVTASRGDMVLPNRRVSADSRVK